MLKHASGIARRTLGFVFVWKVDPVAAPTVGLVLKRTPALLATKFFTSAPLPGRGLGFELVAPVTAILQLDPLPLTIALILYTTAVLAAVAGATGSSLRRRGRPASAGAPDSGKQRAAPDLRFREEVFSA